MLVETYTGLYNALKDTTKNVYSVRPNKVSFPFVEIGDPSFVDSSIKNLNRGSIMVYIHTYTKGTSKSPNLKLSQKVMETIEKDLNIEGYHLDRVVLNNFNVMQEEEENQDNTRVFHGIMTYSITLTKETR